MGHGYECSVMHVNLLININQEISHHQVAYFIQKVGDMGIYYILLDKKTERFINFGKKINNSKFGYDGLDFYYNGKQFDLSDDMLFLLKERFIEKHGQENVIFSPDWELEQVYWLDDDVPPISVGGDDDFSIPLEEYLPELNNPDELIKKGWLIERAD